MKEMKIWLVKNELTWKGTDKISIDEELGELDGGDVEGGSVVAIGGTGHLCVSVNYRRYKGPMYVIKTWGTLLYRD